LPLIPVASSDRLQQIKNSLYNMKERRKKEEGRREEGRRRLFSY
jgi:hypothetical protein